MPILSKVLNTQNMDLQTSDKRFRLSKTLLYRVRKDHFIFSHIYKNIPELDHPINIIGAKLGG